MKQEPKNQFFSTRKILVYGGIDLVFFVLCGILAILTISLFFSEDAMPTSFGYHELSEGAISAGEGRVLITYGILSSLLITSIFLHFIFSILICQQLIVCFKLRKKYLSETEYSFIKNSFYFFCFFICLLFPFVLLIYLYKKGYFDELNGLIVNAKKQFFLSKTKGLIGVISCLLVLVSNAIFIALPTATTLLIETKPYYNRENCQKFYQLSKSKNNVLYFYFDRTDGWKIEKFLQENPLYRAAFKDFTFYRNNLSLSDTTVTSVPSLSFGYNASVVEKSKISNPLISMKVRSLNNENDVIFPGSNQQKINQMSVQDYYKFSLANFVAFGKYLGYERINICNFPYYGAQSPLLFTPNNSFQMNQEMRNEFGFKDFSGINASELKIYKQQKAYYNNLDDAQILNQLGNDLVVSETYPSTFIGFYSQQIHWDVAARVNGHYSVIKGNKPEYVLRAIDDALSELSQLFKKLKNLGIYDNTTIIITSDHGHCYEYLDDKSAKTGAAGYAPIFMLKAKRTSQPALKINSESLITTADQLALIRNILFSNGKPQKDNDPWDPKNRFTVKQDFFDHYHPMNDYQSESAGQREFKVIHPLDGRYLGGKKEIKAVKTRVFHYAKENRREIFDKRNWKDYI